MPGKVQIFVLNGLFTDDGNTFRHLSLRKPFGIAYPAGRFLLTWNAADTVRPT